MDESSLSRHERRLLKREERKEEKRQGEVREKRERGKKNKFYIGLGVLIVILAGYGFSSFPITGNSIKTEFDLSGIPNSFVHWHADVDILVCGEEKLLPEASSGGVGGGKIGPSNLHTHSEDENLRSLPNSDGNGVIHNEAVIPSLPQEQTVGRFLDHMNIPFSETQIMDKKNGDKCADGKEGKVKFFVNGKENGQSRIYIPRDGDFIRIEFTAE